MVTIWCRKEVVSFFCCSLNLKDLGKLIFNIKGNAKKYDIKMIRVKEPFCLNELRKILRLKVKEF